MDSGSEAPDTDELVPEGTTDHRNVEPVESRAESGVGSVKRAESLHEDQQEDIAEQPVHGDSNIADDIQSCRSVCSNVESHVSIAESQGGSIRSNAESRGGSIRSIAESRGGSIRSNAESRGGSIRSKVESRGGSIRSKVESRGRSIRSKVESRGESIRSIAESRGGSIRSIAESRGGSIRSTPGLHQSLQVKNTVPSSDPPVCSTSRSHVSDGISRYSEGLAQGSEVLVSTKVMHIRKDLDALHKSLLDKVALLPAQNSQSNDEDSIRGGVLLPEKATLSLAQARDILNPVEEAPSIQKSTSRQTRTSSAASRTHVEPLALPAGRLQSAFRILMAI